LGHLLEAFIADLGPMQSFGIAAVLVERFNCAAPLLGNRLPRLFQSLCHVEVVRFLVALFD
jgi:hypothetical protein